MNQLGIDPKKLNKKDLIKSIQIKEGSTPCFKTADTYCDKAENMYLNLSLGLKERKSMKGVILKKPQ